MRSSRGRYWKHAGSVRPRTEKWAMVRQRLSRTKKKLAQVEAQLRALQSKHETSKTVGGRISEEWICRVILSAPNTSGRALQESFMSLVGEDGTMIHRGSIDRIKAAFLEMYKDMLSSVVTWFISAQLRDVASKTARSVFGHASGLPRFVHLQLVHVQDEADLRMLSVDASSRVGLPRRGCASKVQMHVLKLYCEGKLFDLCQELEALANKTAPTLATSLAGALQAWLPSLQAALPQVATRQNVELWFTHCLRLVAD